MRARAILFDVGNVVLFRGRLARRLRVVPTAAEFHDPAKAHYCAGIWSCASSASAFCFCSSLGCNRPNHTWIRTYCPLM